MKTLSSKTFLSAVESYVAAPTKKNRDALVAAADEYRERWILGQSSDSTRPVGHAANVTVFPARKQKFDVSRIMDDLQPTCR